MGAWLKKLLAWALSHWKSLGTLAAIGITGRFVKWLIDLRKSWHEGTTAAISKKNAQREQEIRKYFEKIKEFDLKTPGGARPRLIAGPDENQQMLDEAWDRFVKEKRDRHRGLGGRFY